jgi:hypothetical protein
MRFPRALSTYWLAFFAVVLIGLLPLIITFRAPSFTHLGVFLASLLSLLFIPGMFLIRALKIPARGLELPLISLSLGIAASNMVFWALAFLRVTPAYVAWPFGAATGLFVLHFRRSGPPHGNRSVVWPYLSVLLVALLIVAPMAMLPHFASDWVIREDGSTQLSLNNHRDGLLHLSVANELGYSFPPQVPFLAGQPLHYHYGMDLVTAAFHGFSGIPINELCIRYLPTLYLSLFVLSVACFTRRWLGSFLWGLVAAVFVVLGEDFSFIPGLVLNNQRVWTKHYFQVPTIYSLYWINPMPSAMAFLFTGLLCLRHGYKRRHQSRLWVILAGVHFAIMGTFKVFAGLHLLVALFFVAALNLKKADSYWFKASLVALACIVFIIAPVVASQTETTVVDIKPVVYSKYLPQALKHLNLSEMPGFRDVTEMFVSRSPTSSAVVVTLLLGLPLFILGSFGMRVTGIPSMIRSLFSRRKTQPEGALLALFVIGGCVLTLVLKVTPIDFPDRYDNSVWFFVQSKYVAWLFVVLAAARWWQRGRRRLATAATIVILILALPSSLQFFVKESKVNSRIRIPREAFEVVDYISNEAPDGTVVLTRAKKVRVLLLAMTRCRVPYHPIFTESFIRKNEIRERVGDLGRFWKDWEKGSIREDIASKYRLAYVISQIPFDGIPTCYENRKYKVYRLGF